MVRCSGGKLKVCPEWHTLCSNGTHSNYANDDGSLRSIVVLITFNVITPVDTI